MISQLKTPLKQFKNTKSNLEIISLKSIYFYKQQEGLKPPPSNSFRRMKTDNFLSSRHFQTSFSLLSLTHRLKSKQNELVYQNKNCHEFGISHIFSSCFTF
uniref:Uncharacterized protein n=1 Tax=Populus davidiana TaxID=266767 RepID=A0A6M2EH03_9ROSI